MILKNSARVSDDFLNCPNIADVEAKLFCFSTPLICMQRCLPSITTATPIGSNISFLLSDYYRTWFKVLF